MKLYSYEFDTDKNTIIAVEVNVRETPKMFIAEKGEKIFRFSSKVEKGFLDKIIIPHYEFGDYKMFSLNNDVDAFKKKLQEKLTEKKEKHLELVNRLDNVIKSINDETCIENRSKWS